MIINSDSFHHKFLNDFEFTINNDLDFSDSFINNNNENETAFIFKDINIFSKNLNFSFMNITDNNITNIKSKTKNIFNIENSNSKLLNKKVPRTKIFIKSLLNLNLSSYEVNHITKLIKSAWIFGIYYLLNKKLNTLFNKNLLKVEGFVFQFFYVKTSLIETDNTEENLKLFDIYLKDLLTGNLINKNKTKENDSKQITNINNNKKLINFLNQVVENEVLKEDTDFIKKVKEILFILENNISYFAESIWKDSDVCNELENEFKHYCNKELLINKFKKSKEIIKIIISKIESEYPNEIEKIRKNNQDKNESNKKNYLNNINSKYYLNILEENLKIKCYINEIIGKILEISKKDKFENYFKVKTIKNKKEKYI